MSMKSTLSSLLYYDLSTIKHGDIRKGLREYSLLLSALIESLKAFEKGNLESFDALVGENACEIRAIKVALIYKNQSVDSSIINLAIEVKNRTFDLLGSKIGRIISEKLNLKELFEVHDLEIFLSEDELFLLKSFILSEAKEPVDSDESKSFLNKKMKWAPLKIQKFEENVSSKFMKKLTDHLRQQLSVSSVNFVKKTAESFKNDFSEQMPCLTCSLHYHNNLACLPTFWIYKTLLKVAKTSDLPLIVKVQIISRKENTAIAVGQKYYFFKPVQNASGKWSYELAQMKKEDLSKAAWVIEGIADCSSFSDWQQELLKTSIIDAILAGAAAHRQYPDSKYCPHVENSEHFKFKSLALEKGFALENPSTFLMQHVYTSKVESAFEISQCVNICK